MLVKSRRLFAAVAATAAVSTVAVAGGFGGGSSSPQSAGAEEVAAIQNKKCPEGIYTIRKYRWYASRVYKREKVSQKAHRRMDRMLRCQHSDLAKQWVERFHKRFLRERDAWQAERKALALARSLTPYPCTHGNYAIPCYILKCESGGGSWTAANASGAIGPYQFLGWPVPWPVNSAADKLAHHRMAAKLWAGGAGKSHWQQCL